MKKKNQVIRTTISTRGEKKNSALSVIIDFIYHRTLNIYFIVIFLDADHLFTPRNNQNVCNAIIITTTRE